MDRSAAFDGGDGSDELTFKYTVQEGDVADDLDVTGTDALIFNGGTIRDPKVTPAEFIERAIAVAPEDPEVLWYRGLVACREGKYEACESRYTRAAERAESESTAEPGSPKFDARAGISGAC